MPTIDDLALGRATSTLLKGPTGFGKTIAAASYPEPVYIGDWDSRVDSIYSYYSKERKKKIYFDTYGPSDIFKFMDLIANLCEHGYLKVDGDTFRPGSVVMPDSWTNFCIGTVDYQLAGTKEIAKKDKKVGKKTTGGIIIPDWDEYKGETALVTELLDYVKTIPKRHGIHVISTAHPTKQTAVGKDEMGKVTVSVKVNPIISIGQKAAELIPTAYNEVYHFALVPSISAGEKGRRVVYTEATGNEFAKTTMPLPVSFEWTDGLFYEKLMELARKGEEIGGDWDAELKRQRQAESGW
jgi:hypothetical protein